MALTSTEIGRLLQPMKDFAPAILRCAEIVESAEAAERTMAAQAPALDEIRKEADALRALKQQAHDELQTVLVQVEQARKETAEEKTAITASLKDLRIKLKDADEALKAMRDEHANALAGNKQELEGLNIVLDQKKKELADFRRSVPKTY